MLLRALLKSAKLERSCTSIATLFIYVLTTNGEQLTVHLETFMPFPIKRNASIRAAFNAILSAQLLALSIPWWISASVELFSKSTVLHLITALAIVGSPNTATMGLYLLIQIKLNAFQRKKSPVARRVEQIAAFLALSFLLIVDHSNSASMVNGKTRLATMDWSILTRLSRNVSRPMFSSAAHVVLLNAPLLP